VEELKKTAANMYRLGWDERNSGNISLLLDEAEAAEYLDMKRVLRTIPMGFSVPAMAGRLLLVTGTGKYFKNIPDDPEGNLGVIRIAADGDAAELLWGWRDGGAPTSELPSHLMSHAVRLERDPAQRVVLHCHPPYLAAMDHVHPLEERAYTRTLWKMCTESILVFPEGVGVLPWMLCCTTEIGEATAEKMREYRLVVWGLHGIYAAGNTLDETFGLIETVDKAAQVYLLTAHLPQVNEIRDEDLRRLAEHVGLDYRREYLD